MTDQRRPQSVYGVGQDPDPRFTLANERTALAGLRTALGLVLAGVALGTLVHLADHPWPVRLAAAVSSFAGGVMAFYTVRHWAHVERAMRLSEPLPPPVILPAAAVAVGVVGLIATVALLLVGVR